MGHHCIELLGRRWHTILQGGKIHMEWTKPDFEDLRLGFELTLYIYNR
jgi:coenzyme PQQ precursor peptide PqqA